MFAQRAREIIPGGKSKASRELIEEFTVFRDRVGLLFRFNLQPVLNPPEKTIGCFQRARFLVRKQLQFREDWKRFQRACFLQERVSRPVQELEGLHDKFDLPNPARAQLDVSPDFFVTNDVPLDPSLDCGNFVEQIRRRAPGINKGLVLPKKFVGELATAANPPRLDQRETFPGFAKPRIIVLHALERSRERPGRPFRPEAKIDSKKRPIRARSGKGLPNLGSKQVEPFVIGEIRRNLPFVAVEEDDVYVGAMIQLTAAEFSQPENRKIRRRGAPAAAELGVPVLINFSQTNFCQERQFEGCFFQRRGFGYLAQRNPEHLPALPEPKRTEIFCENGSVFCNGMQVSEHAAEGAGRRGDFRLAQPGENFRMSDQARGTNA